MASLKVLVVDDEPGIRSGINRILRNYTVGYPFMDEDFSFELIDAATGEEAIEIIDKQPIDIVLLDNKLPGIEGMDVLEYINKNNKDMGVMMITSYASLDLAVKATNKGAYNFVPKPFTPEELRYSMENITKHLYLKRMTQQLNEAGKQIRFQFLSVLSHELKSPINAVEGYLRVMKERQVGNKLEDYDTMIDRSLERIKGMRTLIMDLLDFTRIESGKRQREVKEIDLTEIARAAIDSMGPYAIQKNVKVSLDAQGQYMIKADAEEIEIIMNNLISNAIKYNRDDGNVYCTIKSVKDGIKVIVEDTGIGMNEEELSRLFQEFTRIKNQKTKNITGSGLGLSIVKRYVESYDGTVEVSSIPDKVSIFTILFPKSLLVP
jgi:signal transduction histidine kinase